MAKKKDTAVYLSKSSLEYWLKCGCPARFNFRSQWEVKETIAPIERGLLVHAMLAGEVDPASVDNREAHLFYDKIKDTLGIMNVDILHTEVLQKFEILPGIVWTRIVDVIATESDGTAILIDYKTAGGGWHPLENTEAIRPMVYSPQSVSYLIDSGDGEYILPWPEKMKYIVAAFRGQGQVYTYQADEIDLQNFYSLLRVAEAGIRAAREANWPKAYGNICSECEFAQMCFEIPGYKRLYKRKTNGRKPAAKNGK